MAGQHLLHIGKAHAVARLALGGAGQLAIGEGDVFLHPVAHREQKLRRRLPDADVHLGRSGFGRRVDGVVEEVGDHDDEVGAFQRDVSQVGEVKIHHHAPAGGLLILFAEQRVQQRVVAVEDGGIGLDRPAHIGKVGLGPLHIPLLQHQAQRLGVVGKLMGQPPLGGVAVQQRFRPLLLQPGLILGVLALHHLLVEHLDEHQMHQHRRRQPRREQDREPGGVQPAARHHQHDVQNDHHAREEHSHGHLQRLQHLLFAPGLCQPGRQQARH